MRSTQQREKQREKLAQLVALLETESPYAPYTDQEMADRLGVGQATVYYWRARILGLPNSFARRATHLGKTCPCPCKSEPEAGA